MPTVEDVLFSFESGSSPNDFQNWGGSFQPNNTTHSIDTNPANATDGTQSLRIDRGFDGTAFKWGSEFYLNAGDAGDLDAAIVVPDPDSNRPAVNATQEEVDDFAARFIGADRIAFDVTIDPSLIDPAATFVGFIMFLNDSTGDFWQAPGGGLSFDPTVADTHTVEDRPQQHGRHRQRRRPEQPELRRLRSGGDERSHRHLEQHRCSGAPISSTTSD